ncbi:energy transducer TonB [Aquimarina addita]|uniref:energy transducer TonB family protein n=1 Tax=Aquimarina addita TaxID=870485 RepID=UPI0031ED3E93
MIITTMLMGIFILSLYNINMINKKKELSSEILMEIPEEFLSEMEEEEEEPLEKENRELIAAKRTHNAFNEDFEDPDDFEERIKSLTEAEEADAESAENSNLAEGEIPIDEQIDEEEDDQKNQKPISKESNNRHSSSSYSLKGRDVLGQIPNPVYTCNGSGKVVVKIEVNANGYVVDTKIDRKKSTTKNECLFENAAQYARRAQFSSAQLAEQKGIITYFFNYGG